jgi:hypothetical protein
MHKHFFVNSYMVTSRLRVNAACGQTSSVSHSLNSKNFSRYLGTCLYLLEDFKLRNYGSCIKAAYARGVVGIPVQL